MQVSTVGSNASVAFTVSSDESWLTASESGLTTPSTITVKVNPSGLAVGPYTGHLTVTPNNSDANLYNLVVTVTLNVGNTAQVSAGPPLLVFSYQTSQNPPSAQVVQLLTQGQPSAFLLTSSVTASAGCPANWLSATANSLTSPQNATLTVAANIQGMTPGTCAGSVTVSYPASSLTPTTLVIPVTMNISNSALLSINFDAGFGTVTTPAGGAQITQHITLTSTDPNTQIMDLSVFESNAPFLLFGNNGTSTPETLQVIFNPASLSPTTYGGTISISSSKLPSSPLAVPVSLTITPTTTVAVSPLTLTFNQSFGGPSSRAAQNVTLTPSASGATFQISVPTTQVCSWLQVNPTSGPASGPVAFSVQQKARPQNTDSVPGDVLFPEFGDRADPGERIPGWSAPRRRSRSRRPH